jgi:hypothetical protein
MEKCTEHSLELPKFAVRFFILISCFLFYIEKFLLQQVILIVIHTMSINGIHLKKIIIKNRKAPAEGDFFLMDYKNTSAVCTKNH